MNLNLGSKIEMDGSTWELERFLDEPNTGIAVLVNPPMSEPSDARRRETVPICLLGQIATWRSAALSAQAGFERLQGVIELDRSRVAIALNAFRRASSAYGWLTDGRGSYEHDDDRYRREFADAMHRMEEAIEPLREVARNWTDCPATSEGVRKARAPLVGPAPNRNEDKTVCFDDGCVHVCPTCNAPLASSYETQDEIIQRLIKKGDELREKLQKATETIKRLTP